MQLKNTFTFIVLWLVINTITAQNNIALKKEFALLTTTKIFIAGSTILLKFKTNKKENYQLYCSNSYGSTIVDSQLNNNILTFKIPYHLSKKRGVLNWSIIGAKKKSGQFTLISKKIPVSMETYLGPPSIEAGRNDYSMLVVIPTDSLDNPVNKGTEVGLYHQFLAKEDKKQIFTENLIAYKNIYSPTKSGRILVSSSCLGLNSKEYSLNVMPAISKDFEIFVKRHHAYADGNQITSLITSILKDRNGNIISDGSVVEFFITNSKGNILKTMGTTINGIATAKMIHPDHEERWAIKAYITGIAQSNVLILKYKRVIKNVIVSFSENNREIEVGPLKSFMNQMIPDGLKVKIAVHQNGVFLKEYLKESRDGYVTFRLNQNIFSNGTYSISIETAGISNEFQNKKLW